MALNFQAFIDDSYADSGEFVLAGHVAPAAAWADFAKDWEELLPLGTLAANGKYHFKMSEMAMVPERMQRLPAFYRVIEKHVTASISCRVNRRDIGRAIERIEPLIVDLGLSGGLQLDHWQNPFFLCFRSLLDTFHLNRDVMKNKIPLDEQVDFIFDNQAEKNLILSVWDEYLEKRPPEARQHYGAAPRFEDDQKFLPLQAADLWAWWVREWYEEDTYPTPDKMRAFDFGGWKGKKKRSLLTVFLDEQAIANTFKSVIIEHAALRTAI